MANGPLREAQGLELTVTRARVARDGKMCDDTAKATSVMILPICARASSTLGSNYGPIVAAIYLNRQEKMWAVDTETRAATDVLICPTDCGRHGGAVSNVEHEGVGCHATDGPSQ